MPRNATYQFDYTICDVDPIRVPELCRPLGVSAPLTGVVCTSHTAPMKVAISLPDPVFQAAERVSRRMRVSRSRLYAKAVEAYVKQHSEEDVTAQLNKVYARNDSTLDPSLEAASLQVVRRERWE